MKRDTLLIVDDMEVNRAILRSLFELDYNLLEADNGEQALLLLNQYQENIAAMLLDIVMPVKDGFQVMAEITKIESLRKVPVIVITSQDSSEDEVRFFDLGASDIIMKPFEPHVVKRRVQNVVDLNRHRLHLEELVEEQAVGLRESREVLTDALSSVIEHRSVESGQHVLRIRMFTKILLEDVMRSYPEYDLDERKIAIITSAAALHDIGKIAIPDAILKKSGPLTHEEFEIMKTHSIKGCEILASLGRMHDEEYLKYGYNICRYHHERWDGNGYPDGLKGDNTPICAQAVGIADAYDALTTDRVYKRAFSPEKAYNMILNKDCGSFSPRLLECFKNVKKQFVKLSNHYADGYLPKNDFSKPEFGLPRQMDSENTLELSQMKYFAMLRYESSTVIEVDMDSGIYHMVYQQNNDFTALRSGSFFSESLFNFGQTAVHPEDRYLVLDDADQYFHMFLDNGLMKNTRKYRVFCHAIGDYIWYEATALRINVDDPREHRLLIVWKALEQWSAPSAEIAVNTNDGILIQGLLIGVLQCLNDQYFTIQHVNDGLINLFGYSKMELKKKFHNRYIEIIHPIDRASVIRQFHEQMRFGNSLELEYRVQTKAGRLIWILDKCQLAIGTDGVDYLNCVLIDITQSKQEKEELRLSMERHQIIMDQSNDIIFEWDIEKDTMKYSSNWETKFGYEPISQQASVRLIQVSHIFPEDIPHLVGLIEKIRAGEPYGEVELRNANAQGQYLWVRIRVTTQFDDTGKTVRAVGVILDIDQEKRKTQYLIDQAERDALTHLYNKNAASRRIRRLLENRDHDTIAAMFLIDMDNFKQVNDTQGHMFGDTVLVEISERLQKLFCFAEVVARIGGDEFLVFINNVSSQENLRDWASKVAEAFRGVFTDSLLDNRLSCSIGISCCPDHGTDYRSLFQRCDQALYHAKGKGKNQFFLFDKAVMGKTFGLGLQQLAANTRIESDEMSNIETQSIVQQAFKELYEAGDVELAVNSILGMVGRQYNVSRAYIFENSENGSYCSNTFEWCNKGISPEIKKLQHITYEQLGWCFYENFNEDGIFYCSDITALPRKQQEMLSAQKIKSLLQCAIRNEGKFVGYVGFDDCTVQRIWTQNQIDALIFVSELLSTFLLKKRAQDQALEIAQDLHMALDNQNSWIYIIDPDDYSLKYINAKIRTATPFVCLGKRCFEVFMNRNTPCEICPAHNIRQQKNQTMEVYNPIANIWSISDASFIRWGKKEACLISCHDITPYKVNENIRVEEKCNEI